MPARANPVNWQATFQLMLLLLALPAQFLIMNYFSASQHQSEKALKDLVLQAQKVSTNLLSWPAWQKWCIHVINKITKTYTGRRWTSSAGEENENTGESIAREVLIYNDPQGHFANSPEARYPKPKNVKFRVGQVITHKRWGYRGVIVGWDAQAKAPEKWLAANHPKGKEHWRTQPNYSILVDTRDRSPPQMSYVPQENIELAGRVKIMNPAVNDYFDAYDSSQYIARPALKELYPDD